jgi:hypothetical protein
MAFTNAEKQKRWRDKRNALAEVLAGTPKEIANGILRKLGASPEARRRSDQEGCSGARQTTGQLEAKLPGLPRHRVCNGDHLDSLRPRYRSAPLYRLRL